MPRPIVPAVADALYDELAVSQPGDETRGYALLILLGALGVAIGPLYDVVRDTDEGPGYSQLLDPERAPVWALPWLSQWAGVPFIPGLDEASARSRIVNPPAFQRGTPSAFIESGQATLTGTKQVRLVERTSDAFHFTAITRTSETPDPAATLRAFMAQKPAGLVLTHIMSDDPIIDEGTLVIDNVGAAVTVDTAAVGQV